MWEKGYGQPRIGKKTAGVLLLQIRHFTTLIKKISPLCTFNKRKSLIVLGSGVSEQLCQATSLHLEMFGVFSKHQGCQKLPAALSGTKANSPLLCLANYNCIGASIGPGRDI